MSDSEGNLEEEDDEPIASDQSSVWQENGQEDNDNKQQLLIHKEQNDFRCATYVFNNEDHTLGNVLRTVLSGNADVQFVGYSIPHPSESKMNLRLQTTSMDANEVLNSGLRTVQNIAKTLADCFTTSLMQAQ